MWIQADDENSVTSQHVFNEGFSHVLSIGWYSALGSGNPGRAMKIHLREIVRAPTLLTWLVSLFPPIWRKVTNLAPGQIKDDENLESLGVGIDRYAHLHVPALLIGGARSPHHLRDRKIARIIESFAETTFT